MVAGGCKLLGSFLKNSLRIEDGPRNHDGAATTITLGSSGEAKKNSCRCRVGSSAEGAVHSDPLEKIEAEHWLGDSRVVR